MRKKVKNEDELDLRLPMSYVQSVVKGTLKAEHADIMSECITGLLMDNQASLELLFKAAIGVRPDVNYLVGDKVEVRYYDLGSSWKLDRDHSKVSGDIYGDNELTCVTIIASHPFNVNGQYTVEVSGMDQDNKPVTMESKLHERYVRGVVTSEEFPDQVSADPLPDELA